MDREVKLNQREFEVLPPIWAKTYDAFAAVLVISSSASWQADVAAMSQEERVWFVAKSDLPFWQKNKLFCLPKDEVQGYYFDAIADLKMTQAADATFELNKALLQNSIYLSLEVFQELDRSAIRLHDMFLARTKMQRFRGSPKIAEPLHEKLDTFAREGESEYNTLATFLRERNWTQASIG